MKIRLLRLGSSYILLAIVVFGAAANTGNNALYMISSLMFGLFLLSGLLSIRSIRNLAVGRLSTGELFAKTPASAFVEICNGGYFPLVGVFLNGRSCPEIPARGSRLVRLDLCYPRRGIHPAPALRLETRFPFGLLAREKVVDKDTVLIYPALGAAELAGRSRRRATGDEERSSRWGQVLDHRGLKPFVEGDDPRHIHWKKTAQRGQLVAVEYDHRSHGACELYLDTSPGDPGRFERDIESVAAACDRLLKCGIPVALTTPRQRFEAGTGEGHRRRLLGFLALVEIGG